MDQAFRCRHLTAEARGRFWVTACGICSGQSGTGTDSSKSSPVFPCQYYSTVALRIHIIWRMSSRPVGVRSSETSSNPIEMNNNILTLKSHKSPQEQGRDSYEGY
jgi:hypothetical protein